MKSVPKFTTSAPFELFLDLDGVFAHFDLRIKQLTGKWPHEITSSQMWKAVYRDKDFFLALEMMEDAHYLWEYCSQYAPRFLTGAPSSKTAQAHKKQWVLEKEHKLPNGEIFVFGSEHDVIVVPRRDKKLYAVSANGKPAVLVDDRSDNTQPWEEAGGIGVLHVSVWATIDHLEHLRTSL